ncbi:electron transfer flavoprotein subunit alpha/FixB family protein [Candidatus Bathyarchaeota archaeon]|nr:MAG: electron transfer flavoprotein subunit alpha/FixB family protein [Candidatus Bathyarchaeota archaeon]RLI16495.1 MAG: electron transfer flavoprotein subunit alpha/FixB family protein [Candidatus Bathyarchaeota archaeon]
MREIFVLTEHRRGQIRDVTFEMLTKGRELAEETNTELTAVLLGKDVKEYAKTLSEYANRVLVVEDTKLENFNSEAYQKVLANLINERKPLLTMMGHTSYGVELAPSLATALNLPLATDCIDLTFENETFFVTRQMYGGKVNVRAVVRKSESYIATVRPATFQPQKPESMNGEITEIASPLTEEITEKRFIEYVLPPPGGVDITAADVLVGIGRGIKDEKNLPMMEELAKALGGVLACSRPIIDKGWLPSDRQVGTSGKTVKPKLYIAVGISGAFQHVLGMKNSDLIIAINKDPNAPIFSFADYGVVDDLFKIVPQLKEKIYELKGQKA